MNLLGRKVIEKILIARKTTINLRIDSYNSSLILPHVLLPNSATTIKKRVRYNKNILYGII